MSLENTPRAPTYHLDDRDQCYVQHWDSLSVEQSRRPCALTTSLIKRGKVSIHNVRTSATLGMARSVVNDVTMRMGTASKTDAHNEYHNSWLWRLATCGHGLHHSSIIELQYGQATFVPFTALILMT